MTKVLPSFEKIYKVVSQIPRGKVATYADIAKLTKIKSPRFVGLALHRNIDPENIPCHRVVRSDGKIASGYAFGGLKKQTEILKKEGVVFIQNDRVNLSKSRLMI